MSFKVKDHYFKKAKKDNYVARSIYKLEEIDNKYSVIKKDDVVLDLGYFPGSWIQYSSRRVGSKGRVVGIDIQEVNEKINLMQNVRVFQKDINDVSSLSELGVSEKFSVVVSDMAPNTTGIKSIDQSRSLNLVEMVFHLLNQFLEVGGNIVIKVFDSHDAQVYLKDKRGLFDSYHFFKPKSTRSISKEFFVIGKGYKGEA